MNVITASRRHLMTGIFNNGIAPNVPGMAAARNAVSSADVTAALAHANASSAIAVRETDEMMARAPDMACMLPYWDKTDAIIEGYEAVKLAAETYLPKFPEEEASTYDLRLQSTKMTNVYLDIIESLAVKPFEEPVSLVKEERTGNDKKEVVIPSEFDEFIKDVDGAGNNITVYSSLTFFNGINSAIDWIFIDYPTAEDQASIRTKADQKAAGVRPYWSHVLGRNVLEARTKMISGKETLTYVRILEPGKPKHIRIFERDGVNGRIVWELWQEQDKPNEANGKTHFVKINGGLISIDEIPLVPFITGRRDGRSFKIAPAMRGAADLQIELYQQESALKFSKIISAYAMLAANGLKPQVGPDGKPLKIQIGPMKVLYGVPDNNGNHGEWSFIQPDAAIMKMLSEDCDKTEQDLRELGKQPLTAQSGNLTVITTTVAAGKAGSAVAAWSIALKFALEHALRITGKFMNSTSYVPNVYIFTEFDNWTEGKDLDALNTARANGNISQRTYWKEAKRRKFLSNDFDPDAEEKLLLDEVPSDTDLEDDDDQKARRPGLRVV